MGGDVGRRCKALGSGREERVLLCGRVEGEEEVEGVRIGILEPTLEHRVVGLFAEVEGSNGGVQRKRRTGGMDGFQKSSEGGGKQALFSRVRGRGRSSVERKVSSGASARGCRRRVV